MTATYRLRSDGARVFFYLGHAIGERRRVATDVRGSSEISPTRCDILGLFRSRLWPSGCAVGMLRCKDPALRWRAGTAVNVTRLLRYTEDCPSFGMFGRSVDLFFRRGMPTANPDRRQRRKGLGVMCRSVSSDRRRLLGGSPSASSERFEKQSP